MNKDALAYVDAFTLVGSRFFLAFIIMGAYLVAKGIRIGRKELESGLVLGVLLFISFTTQTYGLNFTTPARSAFITGLFVVLVPAIFFLLGGKVRKRELLAAIIAFAGLFVLTYQPGFEINFGEALTLICAVAYATHIVYMGKYVRKIRPLPLVVVQFGVVAVLGFLLAYASGTAFFSAGAITPIVLLTIFATIYAFFGQAWAQQKLTETQTGIIFTIEPISAGLLSVLLGIEVFSTQQIAGSVLILAGIFLASVKKN